MLAKFFTKSMLKSFFSTASTKRLQPSSLGKYSQKYTKQRTLMSIYNLQPLVVGDVYVAPNATIAGEVFLGHQVSVWNGTVIRGDINSIYFFFSIHTNIVIGNNCVLHTSASTSTGLGGQLQIQDDCVVQNGCTLYSCTLKERAFIGYNSVVLQGAIIEEGAIIAPNSVVPPGRVVPAMQVWGGNPIKFIRHAKQQQAWVTLQIAKTQFRNSHAVRQMFLPYNNAYLYKENSSQDTQYLNEYGINFVERHAQAMKYDPLRSTMN